MRIGFDAKKAMLNLTGIGNYSRRCINSLSQLSAGDVFLLFAPSECNKLAVEQVMTQNVSIVTPMKLSKSCAIIYELWRNFISWWSIRKYKIDIFHGLSNELPFGIRYAGCKSVVTIHDLIFLRYPHTYSMLQRVILRIKTLYACKKADKIVAISNCTKMDILNYYHVPEQKIEVIYQSINPIFFAPIKTDRKGSILEKYEIRNPFILCVGTIEERKNQKVLINAVPMLNDKVQVIIVGKRTSYQCYLQQIISEKKLSGKVLILNDVSNVDLVYLYHQAILSVYISIYEGFGLPVVEALATGCPVIAAKGSCLEEAGGKDTWYVNPHDAEELAQSINLLLNNQAQRELMSKKGRKYAERFRDSVMAENLMHLYSQMKGRKDE